MRARERVEECLVVVLGINVSVGYGVATVSRIDEIQVSFAEYRLFNRALLQKRPIILSILLTKATPYQSGIEFQEVMMLDIFEQRGQNIHFQIKVPL